MKTKAVYKLNTQYLKRIKKEIKFQNNDIVRVGIPKITKQIESVRRNSRQKEKEDQLHQELFENSKMSGVKTLNPP